MAQACDVVDLPDLPAEGHDVGGVSLDFQRGGLVESVHYDGEGAIAGGSNQTAGFRLRGGSLGLAGDEHALRQGEEPATASDFHVDEQSGS